MFGGDIYYRSYFTSFFEAYNKVKEMMEFDGSRCGTINQKPAGHYHVFLKEAKKTDPSKGVNHNKCSSVFYGRKV